MHKMLFTAGFAAKGTVFRGKNSARSKQLYYG
jgi:hypothetical protein